MDEHGNGVYRSGFVSILGRPNVGKSTLLNAILGERIAITTPKPQTTRHRILGVRHFDSGQIVFLDTPGIHKARGGLNRVMLDTALATIGEGDLIYHMVEVGPAFIKRPDFSEGNRRISRLIAQAGKPAFLIINKIDLVKKSGLLPIIDRVRSEHSYEEIHPVSALVGEGVDVLLQNTLGRMPQGPPYYPDDIVTDRTMRFLASEVVREKTMLLLHEEVPYSVGVVIDRFLERDGGKRFHIDATLFVERDSQKGIVIGRGGQTLRRIGEAARKEMEKFFRKPVGLKLHVKVRKDWTADPGALREFGYK